MNVLVSEEAVKILKEQNISKEILESLNILKNIDKLENAHNYLIPLEGKENCYVMRQHNFRLIFLTNQSENSIVLLTIAKHDDGSNKIYDLFEDKKDSTK